MARQNNQILDSADDQVEEGQANPRHGLSDEDKKDRRADRGLRTRYALWFFWLLLGQLVLVNGIFISVGLDWLKYDPWSLRLFLGATLAQVFGVVAVMTRYLFRRSGK